MGSALLLWAGFQESGQDDPKGSFHFCTFSDCCQCLTWTEEIRTGSKIKASLAFCQALLCASASLFPDLPWVSGFHWPGCARGGVPGAWWWGADVGTGACSGEPAHMARRARHTAVWQWPGRLRLSQNQWFTLLRGKRQHGQPSRSCWLRGWGLEKWMDLMWQGTLENAWTQWHVPQLISELCSTGASRSP